MISILAQSAQDISTAIDVGSLSGPVLMAIIIWGAIKEWWVPGRTHRRMVQERDELLKLALRGTQVTRRTVEAAEKFAPNGEE